MWVPSRGSGRCNHRTRDLPILGTVWGEDGSFWIANLEVGSCPDMGGGGEIVSVLETFRLRDKISKDKCGMGSWIHGSDKRRRVRDRQMSVALLCSLRPGDAEGKQNPHQALVTLLIISHTDSGGEDRRAFRVHLPCPSSFISECVTSPGWCDWCGLNVVL